MIAWKDLVAVLNTGHKPPFSLEDEKQLRRWCCAEFGVETMAVYHWIYSGRLPPHVRQQLVMLWPEVFHKIEYGEKGARYEPQADNSQRPDI